jgi:hypothetical protein
VQLTARNVSELGEPAMAGVGGRVLVAWPVRVGTNTTGIALESFLPSVARSFVGARPVAYSVSHWQTVVDTPVLTGTPGGGLGLFFDGIRSLKPGDLNGEALAPVAASGGLGSPVLVGRGSGLLAAVTLPDGTLISASDGAGDVMVRRGVDPSQAGVDIQTRLLGGCCGSHPALGRDRGGRLWLAWFSNATAHAGIYLVQLDPASGAPIGRPIKAPASNDAWNANHRVVLVCAASCRLVYWLLHVPAQGAPIPSIASWWPSEAQPTPIARLIPTTVTIPSLTAAYRSDGRLWVAWYDARGYPSQPPGVGYYASLGDGRGAGGKPFFIGQPPPAAPGADSHALESVAIGKNLVLASIDGVVGQPGAISIKVVPAPA